MNSIFYDMIGYFIEVYIDDLVVKSLSTFSHLSYCDYGFWKNKEAST